MRKSVFVRALVALVVPVATASACLASPTPTPSLLSGQELPESESARGSLEVFLGFLNRGQFELAARIYSGRLDFLRRLSPSVPPDSLAGLLQAACQGRRLQCLPARGETLRAAPYSTEWVFAVEFTAPGGTLFRTRSLWGPWGLKIPFQSQFPFRVVKANGARYAVLDLPPADP